jgi:hypothetical protein
MELLGHQLHSLNTARANLAGCGLQTAALAFGGNAPGNRVATESWNGTSWTSVNSMNTGREALGGVGISNSSFRIWWICYSSYIFSSYRIMEWNKLDI